MSIMGRVVLLVGLRGSSLVINLLIIIQECFPPACSLLTRSPPSIWRGRKDSEGSQAKSHNALPQGNLMTAPSLTTISSLPLQSRRNRLEAGRALSSKHWQSQCSPRRKRSQSTRSSIKEIITPTFPPADARSPTTMRTDAGTCSQRYKT